MKIFIVLLLGIKTDPFPDIDPSSMVDGLREDILAKKQKNINRDSTPSLSREFDLDAFLKDFENLKCYTLIKQ